MKEITFEQFKEAFDELDFDERFIIYNNWAIETNCADDEIFEFTDDFFDEMFSKPSDAVRAMHFGNIKSWNDEYIRFNGYGNLESHTETEVEEMMERDLRDIFRCETSWNDYIDPYDYEDDEEEEEDEESDED